MAWTIADGLGWLPTAPGQVPHRRLLQTGQVVAPFAPATIPVPLIPGRLAFLPVAPDQVPHRKSQWMRSERFAPVTPALWPLAWLSIYPGQVPHRRFSTLQPERFEPPPSVQVLIAQQMAWLAQYPSTVPHRRTPIQGGSFAAIDPVVAAAGILCVELRDGDLTSPALVSEALTTTGFINEALTSPGLINEGLC